MSVVGIAAEYNPFHSGHKYLLDVVRERMGSNTPIMAVMSGDFVQRGEAASFSKFARAEAAVRCGVSLAIELPLPWCLSSSEGFARGAVGLMRSAGVVDTIAFGSECGDLERLRGAAQAFTDERFPALLKKHLAAGASYASARQRALSELAGKRLASVLNSPNDLLAVDYLRAASEQGFEAMVEAVPRRGSVHDGGGSASELRRRMAAGEPWTEGMPRCSAGVFLREIGLFRGPVTERELRTALLSRLREKSEEELARLPDASEGLEHRLYNSIRTEDSPEAIAMRAKTKRYALSRLRRMLMCAALGVERGDADGTPPYIRVLAMDASGAELLRRMRKTADVPVIVKSARIQKEDERCRKVFDLCSMAHDLYALGYGPGAEKGCGADYRYSPFVLTDI